MPTQNKQPERHEPLPGLRGESTTGGAIGHPYRVRIDFDTGRYAFCKISGRPGEGSLKRRVGVTTPVECGGEP